MRDRIVVVTPRQAQLLQLRLAGPTRLRGITGDHKARMLLRDKTQRRRTLTKLSYFVQPKGSTPWA